MTRTSNPARLVDQYALAESLLQAQADGTFVDPPSVQRRLSLDAAYEIGAHIASRRLQQGWRFSGWKVGFTNREIWSRWGLDQPIVAPVYRETVFAVGNDRGAEASKPCLRVPAGRRAALRIEVEVVFGFECAAESEAGVPVPDWMALGAELVDCHYRGWRLDPAVGVADFGLHAGLVVGPRVAVAGQDAIDELREVTVSLGAGGRPLAKGTGRAVLDGPANVLAELHGPLAKRTAGYGVTGDTAPGGGRTPPRGHGYLVSTGTLTPLVEARLGATYEVEADLLPSFSFALA